MCVCRRWVTVPVLIVPTIANILSFLPPHDHCSQRHFFQCLADGRGENTFWPSRCWEFRRTYRVQHIKVRRTLISSSLRKKNWQLWNWSVCTIQVRTPTHTHTPERKRVVSNRVGDSERLGQKREQLILRKETGCVSTGLKVNLQRTLDGSNKASRNSAQFYQLDVEHINKGNARRGWGCSLVSVSTTRELACSQTDSHSLFWRLQARPHQSRSVWCASPCSRGRAPSGWTSASG